MFTDLADRLRQTVLAAAERFARLPEVEVAHKPAPEKWSKKEILGHLIDSAGNNHQRFVRAQLQDELRGPGYEQESWARCQGYATADWRLLLDLWKCYNLHLANVIALIPPDKAGVRCHIGDYPEMTLQLLVEDYLTHLEHHLRQLDRPPA